MQVNKSVEIGGRTMSIETGRIAKQADGAVLIQYGESVVLCTAQAADKGDPSRGFLPLTVDYREKYYAAGKIPGGFFKREARPSEKETLSSRQIDRPIRPLFGKGWARETQVLCTVLSADQENDTDTLALIGASMALSISSIPFDGPVGAVRISYAEGEYILNPTFEQRDEADLTLTVAATKDAIIMVEGAAHEVSEEIVVNGMEKAFQAIQPIIQLQEQVLGAGVAKDKVTEWETLEPTDEMKQAMAEAVAGKLSEANKLRGKAERAAATKAVRDEALEALASRFTGESDERLLKDVFGSLAKDDLRQMVLRDKVRADGRGLRDIRQITCEVGVLPRAHGSALFTRGETQALVVTTLGTGSDEQRVEALEGSTWKSFMLHYNFPPYSVGEVRRMFSTSRREIGHGNLAERAIEPCVPAEDQFPYTIRVVSEVTESNGSSSMASVCGGSLSLMDAGVTIKAPVAGIAMGLIGQDGNYCVLSDILGLEDHLGDMDFKVTGTADGITALQMDNKLVGIPFSVLKDALEQAREGRLHILGKMAEAITAPRTEMSKWAPRIIRIMIDPEKIRDIIGPGGKMIRKICADTGATVDVEDDGSVKIASVDRDAGEAAMTMIQNIVQDAEMGANYTGRVRRIESFGAFVEILPGKDGLVHISELDRERVENVEDVVQEGDTLTVKVIDIDPSGKVRLSRKAVLMEEAGEEYVPSKRPSGGGGRGRDRDRGGRRPAGAGRR
ncbi:MAG: polyribonucleotide nucleotidyltransferase [Gemmatimonadota bacterium]|nr:MAG: polyribonucleotide nucleotidyltransferase [Gemmatimonadota bacterium]